MFLKPGRVNTNQIIEILTDNKYKQMKIGILGCRGIPNHYGGFEQFAAYLSKGLVALGMEVWVYNSHNHPYQADEWEGVHLIHCYDPEYKIGTAGQFVYDFNCILDSRKRNFDIIYQLGNTSSSVWHLLLPSGPYRLSNMDGLEWIRSKYSNKVRKFLKYAEKLAVNSNDLLIADSEAIQDYVQQTYNRTSVFIPYGAEVFTSPDAAKLSSFGLSPYSYILLISRFQPDNHIEEIIRGALLSDSELPLLLFGNYRSKYGNYLYQTYHSDKIRFMGTLFDIEILNHLRYYSKLYFHGHSSGGTNPSLLEAMACSAMICAHDNPFNCGVLKENAYFFRDEHQIADIIRLNNETNIKSDWISGNIERLHTVYNWEIIINTYYELFSRIANESK
jgi:glycosyltransferase involved in cell wall biosynthesis